MDKSAILQLIQDMDNRRYFKTWTPFEGKNGKKYTMFPKIAWLFDGTYSREAIITILTGLIEDWLRKKGKDMDLLKTVPDRAVLVGPLVEHLMKDFGWGKSKEVEGKDFLENKYGITCELHSDVWHEGQAADMVCNGIAVSVKSERYMNGSLANGHRMHIKRSSFKKHYILIYTKFGWKLEKVKKGEK